MAIIVESVTFTDPDLFNGQPVTWPYGQIEDRFNISIDFRVEAFSIDVDDEQEIVARPAVSVNVPDTANLLEADFLAFDQLNVLDDIEIIGTVLNDGFYQILEKINEDGLILDSPLTFENFPSGAYIQLVTPIRGIRYRWNWVENGGPTTFNSDINGEEMRYDTAFANAASPGFVTMEAKGKNEYKFGQAFIGGLGISGGSQRFTIVHIGMILPSFLAGQYDDLKSGILPPWYLDGNCLKHIFEIEANHELADPNRIQTVLQDEQLGNTGGFGESFNGGLTNYSISNVQIQRIVDLEVLSQLDLQTACTVNFDIDNPTSIFVDAASQAHLKFSYLPSQTAFYQNTGGKDYVEAFYKDFAVTTAGSTTVGANFGTDSQVITNFEINFTSVNKLSCSCTIDLALAAQNVLIVRDKPQYRLMVTAANHTVSYAQSDKSTLIIDVNEFLIKLTDLDLIQTVKASFITHPYTDSVLFEPLTACPLDDLVSEQQFAIDFTGKTEQGIIIKSVTTQIIAKSGGNPDIILENNFLDTANFPLVDGFIQEIGLVQDRGYKIPEAEIRRKISVKRNTGLDSATTKNWVLQYGFVQRLDEWNEVLGITNPVTGIYDSAEPFNGFNNDWLRYTTIAGYELNARHIFLVEQNGENFTQTFDFPYTSVDFLANPDWTAEKIEIWDTSYGLPGFQNLNFGEFYIRGSRDSPIKLFFTWSGVGTAPAENEVAMVLWFGVTSSHDPNTITRGSSVYDKSGFSWIVESKITVTKTGNDYLGECTLDYTKLPEGELFVTAYARIYEPIIAVPINTKTTSPDDTPKTTTLLVNKTIAP